MKKILVSSMLLAMLVVGVPAVVSPAAAQASPKYEVSGSCEGNVSGYGRFRARTRLKVSFDGGKLDDHYNYFYFYGFLDDMDNAPYYDWDRSHVMYRKGKYDIAVPYIDGAGLFFRDNRYLGRDAGDWIRLCDY
ncbi:hypothetical protein [Nocardia sp. NPDC050710]|uniref:hypothetical protein n=1 Tax=Nocardia sp. NPDC050710 TaxID=3157220 RepID=UPI0033EE608F